MSAIAGVFYLNGNKADLQPLQRMLKAIAHRGTDEGFFVSRNIALGHRRLPILDLTKAGHQPMASLDRSLTIASDGRIYNSPEIRQELEGKGYHFRSKSDAEVILHSYEEWGVECLKRFNGMWAFAIWDEQKRELFCARDRFGEKPFYYCFDGNAFIFASEIKAILEYPGLKRRVNEEVVYDYLMWGLFDYSGSTFFKGIKELSPAHYLLINAKDGLVSKRWWNLEVNSSLAGLSEDDANDAVKHFRILFEDAVRIRLRSDVPIGTTLSGGLDSSSIAVLAKRLMLDKKTDYLKSPGGILKTFSSCYEGTSIDERAFIEKVLQTTGAEANYVFPDGDGLWKDLPRLVWHHDEPTDASSTYARWRMIKEAKASGVSVILTGDGSDELLAGYRDRYYTTFLLELALKGRVMTFLKETRNISHTLGIWKLLAVTRWNLGRAFYARTPAAFQSRTKNFIQRLKGRSSYKILISPFDKQFSRHGLAKYREKYGKPFAHLHQSLVQDFSELARVLRYVDRSSAAFSIEARAPFLDYRLVEYLFSLPSGLKIRNGWTKWLLREAMQGLLPDEVRLRTDKLGFPTPTGAWLRSNMEGIKGLFSAKDVLSSQFIKPDFIRDNTNDLLSRGKNVSELWRYVNFELWLRNFFGNRRR